MSGGKIKRNDDNTIFSINSSKKLSYGCLFNSAYILTEDDLLYNGWKIIEPEYNWNKIIKDKVLCIFSNDKDLRTLLPLPLSQRQCNLNDIFQELRDIDKQLVYGEYDISHTRSVIEDMNEKLDKYIHTYAKDGE